MKIIDSHHHIWRRADLEWLRGPTQPRIFGNYNAIKRDYLINEFRQEAESAGVVKSVYVQANWPVDQFAKEAAWVQQVRNCTGWPNAIVAYCDLTQPDARRDLDQLASYSAVRGIRQQLHWHKNPLYRFATEPDLARNANLQRNVSSLSDYAWSFDLQVFAPQMDGACELVDACPNVTFVLQHAGMLEDLTEEGWQAWRTAIFEIAKRPNVNCKLSGLGTFIHRNDANHIRTIVKEAVTAFGADRCLFGSNFPIEKLWTDYGSLVDAYAAAISELEPVDQQAILHDTAIRIYAL